MPTVLILDDQTIGLMILEELIHSIDENIHVECFSDPIKALEWAKHNNHDLVITDYNMPEMDGEALVNHVRANSNQSSIPIIMVTSEENENRLAAVQQAGVSAICDKPFEPGNIRTLLQQLFSEE